MGEDRLRPLAELSEHAAEVRGVLFDLDDTFLSHGALTRGAYAALFRLKAAGKRLVAVTGRPFGWGEVLLPQWPIDAIVVENGALTLARSGRALTVDDPVSPEERAARFSKLRALKERVREKLPTLKSAEDAWLRRSDTNWDIGETCTVDEDTVRALEVEVKAAGAMFSRSSVHAHASFDQMDKAAGSLRALAGVFGETPAEALSKYVFVGDSPNDTSCFREFRLSVGVSNVRDHLARIEVAPRYVANGERGEGFEELVRVLLGPVDAP